MGVKTPKLPGLKMRLPDLPKPIVVIVGPTAVGKTELSIQLAVQFDGEIISTDSRQFYRGMDIGTAKPTADEQSRVPHHLIDTADPDETWSLALFQKAARAAIEAIHARQKLPFLVGGTGQFVRAVIEGWDLPEQEPDPSLRSALERWGEALGGEELHQRLAVIDPDAARFIQHQNIRRTVRALEVIFRTGKRFSELRQRKPSPYSLLIIGLARPRSELFMRIDERIDQMVSDGLVDEVRRLLERGYSKKLPSMSAIGYREIAAYLEGDIPLEEAVAQIKRATRIYVRRQANWFKPADANIHWIEAGPGALNEINELIQSKDAWIMAGGDVND
jgi:tRNA dimethylallyltransferase